MRNRHRLRLAEQPLSRLPCSAQFAGASTPAEGGRRNGTFRWGDLHGGRGPVVGMLSAAGLASARRATTRPDGARLGGIGGRERRTAPGAGRAGRGRRGVELSVGIGALGKGQRRDSDDAESGSRQSGREKRASCRHDEHPPRSCRLPTRTWCPGNRPAAGYFRPRMTLLPWCSVRQYSVSGFTQRSVIVGALCNDL